MVFFKRTLRTLSLAVVLASVVECIPQLQAAGKKAETMALPAVVPAGGVFTSSVSVTLTGAFKEIRYTLDGTEPGTNSPLYTAPLVLTNTALIQARGFASPTEASPTTARAFTFLDTNVAGFNSSLPLVVIQTFGSSFPTPSNAMHWMQVFNVQTNQRAALIGAVEFGGPVQLKPRGYTSLRYPKRSLTVETTDAEGKEVDVPLLGMPAESDWVLYAPYPDKTLMRDVLAYELSNKVGHYAARTRFVEVFINDSTNRLARGHYAGVYVLEEKVKISQHRVAIHKMSAKDNAEPNITGGYLFKKDHLEKARGDVSESPARPLAPFLSDRYPTGPGGFPALATGFLPPADPPAFTNALAVITNNVAITNVVSGTNIILPPPTVTVVRMNSQVVTNMVSVTNSVVTTNLVVMTNRPVVTNVTVTSTTVITTNPVVATQAVAGTNTVATTNHVDGTTAVITTTTTVTTSATYRTNFVAATNVVMHTNAVAVTNLVVMTNSVVVTNIAITSVPILSTNKVAVTNYFRLGPADLSPYAEMLMTSGEGFVTSNTSPFFFVEPKPTKITPAQRAWLTNYLNRFETVLYGPDFRNPTNGYPAFIDVDSFIDHHLFVEATKNIDGFRFSTYFTKDRGGKLKIEPIWDWNLSLGNAKGKQGYMSEHWYWPQLDDQQYSWYRRLFEDPDFGQRYVDRWAQWRTNAFATSNLLARIDALAAELKEPAARNFERWPILGSVIDREYFAGKTWDEDIQYLKTWITNRMAWIDAQFVPPPVVTRAPVTPAVTNTIHFVAPTGQVYFTTDGSDPRLTNGNVSSTAKVYQAPVAVPKATRVVARTRNANGWSSPVALRMEE
jgi:hypothetical protein